MIHTTQHMKTDAQNQTWGTWSHVPTAAIGAQPSTVRRDIVANSEFGPAFIAGDILPDHARLIASAPELLQVVEDYVLLCDLHDYVGAVPDAARAALRKARREA